MNLAPLVSWSLGGFAVRFAKYLTSRFVAVLGSTLMLLASANINAAEIELTPIQVAPHVYYFQGQAGMASAANKGFMSNAGFVVTDAGVVVYDALATPVLGEAMISAIRRVTKQAIKKVIVGHYHADHVYGLQAFKNLGAEIIAHENGKAYLYSDLAQQRLAQRRADLFPWVDENTRLVAADTWLQFNKQSTIRFSLGTFNFQIIDSSGAHSDEDLLLLVENEGALFAGDIYFSGRLPFVGNADSRVWLGTLSQLNQKSLKVVIPGHGRYATNPKQDIEMTMRYLQFLREKMGLAVQELISFDQAYDQTDWREFEKFPAFKEANRINAYGTYLLMEKESLKKP